MQDALGAVVKDHAKLTDLAPGDHAILLSKGITDADWAVWRLAKPEYQSWIKRHALTPDSIYAIPNEQLVHLGNPAQLKENAAVRLIGAITEETHMAVVEPGARDRAWINKMGNRGTWGGELVRSVLLFKSFPIAMINRHLLRGLSMPSTGGKAAYLAAVIVGSTVAGMVSLQVDQLVSGKDPRKIDQWQNWVNAFLKGGALGMYGDFLFSDTTRYGQSPFESAEGPVLGLVADVFKLTQGNTFKSAENKNVHLGADAVRFARGNVPLINLWYTKAAMDHLIWNQLSEYFSPGYLERTRSRARRQYQQDYWWTPTEDTPHRAPDLEHVTGKQP